MSRRSSRAVRHRRCYHSIILGEHPTRPQPVLGLALGKHPTWPQSMLGLVLLRGQALGGSVLPSSLPTRSLHLHPSFIQSIVPAGLRARASSSSFVEVAARPNGTYLSVHPVDCCIGSSPWSAAHARPYVPSFLWPSSHRRGSRTARPLNGPPASPTTALLFLPTCSFVRDFGKLAADMSTRFSSSREGEERVCERERGAKQDEAPGRAKRLIECWGTGSHTRDARARPWAPRDVRLPFLPSTETNRRRFHDPSVRAFPRSFRPSNSRRRKS